MLARFNQFIERWIFLVTPVCVILGVVFSDITIHGNVLVPYVFAVMTFIGALKSSFQDIVHVFRHPLPLLLSMVCIHIIMPVLAFGAGSLFFSDNINLITGMVLEFAVPSAVIALMWVTIYNGSSALSLSLVIVDTVLAPFLIPLTLRVIVGSRVQINTSSMIEELLFMIALPAVAAMCLNQFSKGKVKETWPPKLAPISKICLMFIQICNSSKAAPYIRHMNRELLEVIFAILILAAFGYALGWIAAVLFKQDRKMTVSMMFGVGMRNISAGAVIASSYFPAEVVFPVITATLFQQVLAAVYGTLFHRIKKEAS